MLTAPAPGGCARRAGLGRELLLLSPTTGHSLHMHSIDATIKHKIIESSDWQKLPQIYSKVGYSGQTDCTQSLDRHLPVLKA